MTVTKEGVDSRIQQAGAIEAPQEMDLESNLRSVTLKKAPSRNDMEIEGTEQEMKPHSLPLDDSIASDKTNLKSVDIESLHEIRPPSPVKVNSESKIQASAEQRSILDVGPENTTVTSTIDKKGTLASTTEGKSNTQAATASTESTMSTHSTSTSGLCNCASCREREASQPPKGDNLVESVECKRQAMTEEARKPFFKKRPCPCDKCKEARRKMRAGCYVDRNGKEKDFKLLWEEDDPVTFRCEYCQKVTVSSVRHRIDFSTVLWAFLCGFLYPPLALFPFFCYWCKRPVHSCSECGQDIVQFSSSD